MRSTAGLERWGEKKTNRVASCILLKRDIPWMRVAKGGMVVNIDFCYDELGSSEYDVQCSPLWMGGQSDGRVVRLKLRGHRGLRLEAEDVRYWCWIEVFRKWKPSTFQNMI
ncbi:hypothetical protein NPIL_100191 [Nephila pilipes]|uniref:Uncharacterized protein n=1 Tax=Nephila pilipes TaxID=299642 RepID=A0A8X6NV63_NEPPI|nr:hypothetical protein NPIL_100191 [Nephila pilipes]